MTHHLVGMAEIAEMLGVSRQRVGQLIETYEDFPKPEVELSAGRIWSRTAIETWIATHPDRGPGRRDAGDLGEALFGTAPGGMFQRFTDRARMSVVKAQEEARLLNHSYIGTEHILLGLLAIGDGVAHDVLVAHHVTLADARRLVDQMIGRGASLPEGRIPFTPRAKKVLELSLREAMTLGHNYIGTEHVLLGLIRVTDGAGWKALEEAGLKTKALQTFIVQTLRGIAPPSKDAWFLDPGTRDEFIGKLDELRGLVDRMIDPDGV